MGMTYTNLAMKAHMTHTNLAMNGHDLYQPSHESTRDSYQPSQCTHDSYQPSHESTLDLYQLARRAPSPTLPQTFWSRNWAHSTVCISHNLTTQNQCIYLKQTRILSTHAKHLQWWWSLDTVAHKHVSQPSQEFTTNPTDMWFHLSAETDHIPNKPW